jgi:oxygen-dependent protoporphyrinogen oxidase
VSLDDGMQRLVDTLVDRIGAARIRLSTPVTGLRRGPAPGPWRVVLAGGANVEADAVVLATPAHHAARIVTGLDRELAAELAGIPYASSVVVTLAYRRRDLSHPLDGFGFVVPLVERRRLLACTFSSVKYAGRAPADHVLLRAFLGGVLQARFAELGDADLETAVRQELAELLGITAPPELVRIHRHAEAMPQYHVGHLARVGRIDDRLGRHPGLVVAGSAYRGIGIPDCIRGGETAAEAVITTLRQP